MNKQRFQQAIDVMSGVRPFRCLLIWFFSEKAAQSIHVWHHIMAPVIELLIQLEPEHRDSAEKWFKWYHSFTYTPILASGASSVPWNLHHNTLTHVQYMHMLLSINTRRKLNGSTERICISCINIQFFLNIQWFGVVEFHMVEKVSFLSIHWLLNNCCSSTCRKKNTENRKVNWIHVLSYLNLIHERRHWNQRHHAVKTGTLTSTLSNAVISFFPGNINRKFFIAASSVYVASSRSHASKHINTHATRIPHLLSSRFSSFRNVDIWENIGVTFIQTVFIIALWPFNQRYKSTVSFAKRTD